MSHQITKGDVHDVYQGVGGVRDIVAHVIDSVDDTAVISSLCFTWVCPRQLKEAVKAVRY